jgi:hypothetical protein
MVAVMFGFAWPRLRRDDRERHVAVEHDARSRVAQRQRTYDLTAAQAGLGGGAKHRLHP